MEKRKIRITRKPTYLVSEEGQKIFISEVEAGQGQQEPAIWRNRFLKLLCAMGWVLFFSSIHVR